MRPPLPRSLPRIRLDGAAFGALAALALVVGCGGGGGGADAAPSASAEVAPPGSASAATSAAPSGTAATSPAPADDTPTGKGTATFAPATGDAACAPASFELATYLMRGELTLAGKATPQGGEIAASWLVQLPGKAQIGFAGFDAQARRLARDRGIGSAREHAPRLFSTGDGWTVAWFDAAGLAYARPRWASDPPPEVEHLAAVKDVEPHNVALAVAPNGSLVAASPFGTQGDQLSLFSFAPVDGAGPKASAIGVSKNAKKPSTPAVSADAKGYTLAWIEGDGSVRTTRFEANGTESGSGSVARSGEGARTALGLAPVDGGALLTWQEGEQILARRLGETGAPASPVWVVGQGKHPTSIGLGADALVAFLAGGQGEGDQLVVVRVGPSGPGGAGRRVSDGKTAVLDPPAIGVLGDRVAFAWTEVMGPVIRSKRAWLRTVPTGCVQ